jgi:predicted amidophosphoribosyltransferase
MRAAVVYDELARAFLLRAKLGRRPELLEPLGRFLAQALRGATLPPRALVVPVPSHPWMNLRRGFVPARELARPVARELGLPFGPRVLGRRLYGPLAAKRLGARSRRALALGAFHVLRSQVRGRHVLLVDDVVTTGSTLDACARALRRAGALRVFAAAWARTLPGSLAPTERGLYLSRGPGPCGAKARGAGA